MFLNAVSEMQASFIQLQCFLGSLKSLSLKKFNNLKLASVIHHVVHKYWISFIDVKLSSRRLELTWFKFKV